VDESLIRRVEQLAEEFADLPLRTVIDAVVEQAERPAARQPTEGHIDTVTTAARRRLSRIQDG
jgi:hypothetical protein